ncbi:hypothetical protein [Luteimonas terricola]|uniref:Lipoprotein n=1 Tax=Luteimonas terricola TaxID=645597 RepID=A0ABQ2EH15_9GAMM|nr:hypothetical protein [Luteimonas terricola]GGK08252.1 hypothetical protein GCM10011394_16970 [Luteimonas terricola]
MKQMLAFACGLFLAGCVGQEAAVPPSPGVAASGAVADGDAGMFCAEGEDVVFGCKLAQGHTVALCASPGLAPAGGELQYRENVPGEAADVAWPQDGTVASQAYRSGTLMYSGGGGAFLRFDREGRTYTVYTGIGRGWEKAGVLVQAQGNTVANLACDGEEVSAIGPELFARAGIPEDADGFEIP